MSEASGSTGEPFIVTWFKSMLEEGKLKQGTETYDEMMTRICAEQAALAEQGICPECRRYTGQGYMEYDDDEHGRWWQCLDCWKHGMEEAGLGEAFWGFDDEAVPMSNGVTT
jgi:hypothetical protein